MDNFTIYASLRIFGVATNNNQESISNGEIPKKSYPTQHKTVKLMVNDFKDAENYELTDEQINMFGEIFLDQETYRDLSSLMSALLIHELFRRNLR